MIRVKPHILMSKGDVIRMPGGNADHLVTVVDLIEGQLLVEEGNNRFVLPWGFYLFLESQGQYCPLKDYDESYFNLEDDKTWDFCE